MSVVRMLSVERVHIIEVCFFLKENMLDFCWDIGNCP